MVDIISRPSHSRNILSPELLTGTSADCVDGLRDELVVEWQGDVPYVEESVIAYVERTGGIAGHSPFEHLFGDIGA